MTVVVKYRDVPRDELPDCCRSESTDPGYIGDWDVFRGTSIEIETPAMDTRNVIGAKCNGPFFRLVGDTRIAVCSHIAEIGD
jgi:hypothetical protein